MIIWIVQNIKKPGIFPGLVVWRWRDAFRTFDWMNWAKDAALIARPRSRQLRSPGIPLESPLA